MKQFDDPIEAQALALAIVDTLPDPFLVLDHALRVLAASRCFYELFEDGPDQAHGRSLFELSEGCWQVPGLRSLLENVVSKNAPVEGFEFEQDFKRLGRRTIQLSARPIRDQSSPSGMVLLAIKDITSRRLVEREKAQLQAHTDELLEQQKTLLREMRHRIANSLQIIASILLLKAGAGTSEETKNDLRDAHQRVMSVATVQNHLHEVEGIEEIDVSAYLTKLGAGLASSMIGPKQDISIAVSAGQGTLPSGAAVSLGLIVTELVINAIKYAFPAGRMSARIAVTFDKQQSGWALTVSDNGEGRHKAEVAKPRGGLGTALISALSKQLGATVSEVSNGHGLTVKVCRADHVVPLPKAA
jgi:two-component sensor histidine kinase